jgi:hypothetical protein
MINKTVVNYTIIRVKCIMNFVWRPETPIEMVEIKKKRYIYSNNN